MVFAFSSATSAESELSNEIKLTPAKNTEIIFESANLVESGEEVTVTVTQEFTRDEEVSSEYNIEVDLNNLTYTVEEAELVIPEAIQQPKGISSMAAASSAKYLFVTARTLDPPGEVLNTTRARLWWTYGSSSSKLAGGETCTANAQTNLFTTWYVDSCLRTADSTIDGGRTQTLGAKGSFHNYDWLYDNLITKTSHNVYLEGYIDGTSSYTATWTKSGESSSILRMDTLVEKGNM